MFSYLSLLCFLAFLQASFTSAESSITSTFSFPPFGLLLQNVSRYNAASIVDGTLLLNSHSDFAVPNQNSARVLYRYPIRFLSHNTSPQLVASFSTSFTFSISHNNTADTSVASNSADGMAFLLCPRDEPPPENSNGGYLGLVDPLHDGKPSNHLFAIEFDTHRNVEFSDPSDSHVGVNLNGIISNFTKDLSNSSLDLRRNSYNMTAYIFYNSTEQLLEVFLRDGFQAEKPPNALLLAHVNLSDVVQEFMFVGFSAATGDLAGRHQIFSWNFSTSGVNNSRPIGSNNVENASSSNIKKPKIFVAAVIAVTILVLLALLFWAIANLLLRWKREQREDDVETCDMQLMMGAPRRYSYQELYQATQKFSKKQLLGQGGFGCVYKGVLADGKVVAVKQMADNSKQGLREFQAELRIIGQLKHRNLMQLQGWCYQKGRMMLVSDYMSNGSLDKLLYGGGEKKVLEWKHRYNILMGVASALAFLHEGWEQRVLHRDVKASNVLVDAGMNARLGDFGLARLVDHSKLEQTMTACGTYGYVAPEVIFTGKATDRSDVYSFGMLCLELACGRPPLDETQSDSRKVGLLQWVVERYEKGQAMEVVDENLALEEEIEVSQLRQIMQIGLVCCNPDPVKRPSMRRVCQFLSGDAPLPPILAFKHIPSFFFSSSTQRSKTKNKSNRSKNNLKRMSCPMTRSDASPNSSCSSHNSSFSGDSYVFVKSIFTDMREKGALLR